MIRRIVVPLDGSAFAEYALPFALEVARATGAALELVHVDSGTHRAHGSAEPSDADERLDALAARLETETGVPTTARVLRGVVAATLEAYVRAGDDLVVMATHGRSGPSRAWLGSVADELVRRVDAPVLLVRPPDTLTAAPPLPRFERVLVPLDGSGFAEKVLDALAPLFDALDSRLTLLAAVPTEDAASKFIGPALYNVEEERTRLGDYLRSVEERFPRASTREVVVAPSAARAILRRAESDDCDLVAMATHRRGGLGRLVLGSVADKVLRGSRRPVLLLPADSREDAPESEARTEPLPAF